MTKNHISIHTTGPAPISSGTFPFDIKRGWLPGPARQRKAVAARSVFSALWEAHNKKVLTASDIYDTFFQAISDLISYRDGWHCGRYWSVEAWETARNTNAVTKNGLKAEHVLPRRITLQHALTLNQTDALDFVWQGSFYCMVTKEENQRLTAAGLSSEGSPDDPWQRYAHDNVKIPILDAEDQTGNKLIPGEVRTRLEELGILAKWQSSFGQRVSPSPTSTVRAA